MHANCLVYIASLIAENSTAMGAAPPWVPLPLASSTLMLRPAQIALHVSSLSISILCFYKCSCCCLECLPCRCLVPNPPGSMPPSPSVLLLGALDSCPEGARSFLTPRFPRRSLYSEIALPLSLCIYVAKTHLLHCSENSETAFYAETIVNPQYMLFERMNELSVRKPTFQSDQSWDKSKM